MSLLTEGEINNALGATLTKLDQRNQGPGDTMCQWARESASSGITMVSFRFLDGTAIRAVDREVLAGTGTPAPRSVAQYFNHLVKFHRDTATLSPEAIPGIGERAMLLLYAPSSHVIVQRTDGVGHVVGLNVTRNQMMALGRVPSLRRLAASAARIKGYAQVELRLELARQ
jgi:hypothetical protein